MAQSNLSSSQNQYEISTPEFTITYTPDPVPTVLIRGGARLEIKDVPPISELLNRVIDDAIPHHPVTLDLRQLSIMNSQGISVLFKFAINLRQKKVSLDVLAIKSSVWQQVHLDNIPKLSPESVITWSEETD